MRNVRSGFWDLIRSLVMLCKRTNKYRICVGVYNRCLIQLYSQVGEMMLLDDLGLARLVRVTSDLKDMFAKLSVRLVRGPISAQVKHHEETVVLNALHQPLAYLLQTNS